MNRRTPVVVTICAMARVRAARSAKPLAGAVE
jgi:hypothetical protein